VVYDAGGGARLVSVGSTAAIPVWSSRLPKEGPLTIVRARRGWQPDASNRMAGDGLPDAVLASFAVGPGVCVWLHCPS